MGLLKALIKTAVEVPISLTKDVLTLGGTATDSKAETPKKYKEILRELDE